MSEARFKFYDYWHELEKHQKNIPDVIEVYITELEQQNEELIEFIKNIDDTNLDELLDVKIPKILEKYTGGDR